MKLNKDEIVINLEPDEVVLLMDVLLDAWRQSDEPMGNFNALKLYIKIRHYYKTHDFN